MVLAQVAPPISGGPRIGRELFRTRSLDVKRCGHITLNKVEFRSRLKLKVSLRSRKQQFMRYTIFDAAIETFAAKGFDEATVEDAARAAGVSRASFL